jgi:hypothetical protein
MMKPLASWTTKQKWIAAGLILLAASAINHAGGDNRQQPSSYGQNAYNTSGYRPQQYLNDEQPSDGSQSGDGYGNATLSGENTPADVTSGYWERQKSQDQTNHAFGQYINDTTTVKDNETGERYYDVPNPVADPAVESGNYAVVPTADLPTSYDSSSSSSTTESASSE